jgi:hypothetical protein
MVETRTKVYALVKNEEIRLTVAWINPYGASGDDWNIA